MTDVIVEVGPLGVVGPEDVDVETVAAALASIDDELVLVGERAVSVDELWRDMVRAAVGPDVGTAVVVCPSWWSSVRVDRVQAAAASAAPDVVLLGRSHVLQSAVPDAVIVEPTEHFTVVTRSGVTTYVTPADDLDAVLAAIGTANLVVLDAPAPSRLGDRLRATGITVRYTDGDMVRRAAAAMRSVVEPVAETAPRPRSPRRPALLAGAASVALLCAAFAVDEVRPDSTSTTNLVEGAIAVIVPAAWPPERITSGPGSARLQLVSPTDAGVALHITQATGGAHEDVAATARSLRAALNDEPHGVFVDFTASGQRAGRPAITYREVRGDRQIEWTVVVDGSMRIAIGCQSAAGNAHAVRTVCDDAIRSAHVVEPQHGQLRPTQ